MTLKDDEISRHWRQVRGTKQKKRVHDGDRREHRGRRNGSGGGKERRGEKERVEVKADGRTDGRRIPDKWIKRKLLNSV